MATHKGQHWIPANAYLRAWTDPNAPARYEPYVHIFDRDGTGHRMRAPRNIFKETELYTIKTADGKRDLRFERGLAQLEQSFSQIRRDFLAQRKSLPTPRYVKLVAFVAAMHSRTPMIRDHHAKFWKEVESLMEELDANMKKASPEQRKRAASLPPPSPDPKTAMHLADVKKITDSPMEHTLVPYMEAEIPLLLRMSCLILCSPGKDCEFITSDSPVVWYDPDAYKRPPLFRSPSFSSPNLQITFPISPAQMLLLVHGNPSFKYVDVSEAHVREANRITRAHCHNEFVANRNVVDPHWLDPGTMPPDAWELTEGAASRQEPNEN